MQAVLQPLQSDTAAVEAFPRNGRVVRYERTVWIVQTNDQNDKDGVAVPSPQPTEGARRIP
jgi:hypothetical protein